MKAYDIAQQFKALEDLQDFDEETGELKDGEAYYSLLAEIEASREDKLVNIEKIKRSIEADNDLIASEIKRLQSRKKANETKVGRLEALQLMLVGSDKIETPFFKFSTRKSESLKVPDMCDGSYPKEWIVIRYQFDKKAIKEDIKKSGIDYSDIGIELVTNVSLQVR